MSQRRSMRQLLDFDISVEGLLPIEKMDSYGRPDLLDFQESTRSEGSTQSEKPTQSDGLDALYKLILACGNQVSQEIDNAEDIQKAAAVTVAALVGINAARLDFNWRLMDSIYSWCDDKLPSGASNVRYAWLEAARVYSDLGKRRRNRAENPLGLVEQSEQKCGQDRTRHGSVDASEILEPDELVRVLRELLDRTKDVDREDENKRDYFRYLALFLLEAVAQLSYQALRDTAVREWLDWLLENLDDRKHGYTDDSTNRDLARFRYILSRIRLAQSDTPEAMRSAIYALQYAPEWDLPFKESCRQQILILEQEIASNEGIKSELQEMLEAETRKIQEIVEKQEEEFRSQQNSFSAQQSSLTNLIEDGQNESKTAIESQMKTARDEAREEIRQALLRVIEILGIFIAIAGVAVTSVGGIVAGRSFLESLAIFALGYAAIVSLFVLLRKILDWKPREKGTRGREGTNTNGT